MKIKPSEGFPFTLPIRSNVYTLSKEYTFGRISRRLRVNDNKKKYDESRRNIFVGLFGVLERATHGTLREIMVYCELPYESASFYFDDRR